MSRFLGLCLLTGSLICCGCRTTSREPEANRRMKELIAESEDLRQIELEIERFWMNEPPHGSKPERVHGGARGAFLTVANVLKEEALLFRVSTKGELRFVSKVLHGEAVDLPAEMGERYAAVFASGEPHQLGFVVEMGEATWLLRKPATRKQEAP